MLPGVSGTELLILAAVALVVVGPKDLPMLMRKVGQLLAKARSLATEFRSSFDEMSRQAELDDLRKEVEQLRQTRLPDVIGSIDTGLENTMHEIEADLHATGAEVSQGLVRGGSGPTPLGPEFDLNAPQQPSEFDIHPSELQTAEEVASPPLEDPAPIVRAEESDAPVQMAEAKPARARTRKAAAAKSGAPPASLSDDPVA